MNTAMRERPWLRLCTGVLAAGGVAVSALGLATGVAQAAPAPVTDAYWCPGQQWNPGWGNNWDWNNCHDWEDNNKPGWLGPASAVGAAAATAAAVGALGSRDVEPRCESLGVLEQRDVDAGLTGRRPGRYPAGPPRSYTVTRSALTPPLNGQMGIDFGPISFEDRVQFVDRRCRRRVPRRRR